jgi:hypothetical protein
MTTAQQVLAAVDLGEAGEEAEVGDLDVPADEEEVARLDVQVLQPVLLVEEVEDLGGLTEVGEGLGAGDAGHPLLPVLGEEFLEAAVSQLGDDDEVAGDDLDALDGKEERMAKAFDVLQGPELPVGAAGVPVEARVALDELDGLAQPGGRPALPNLAEAALAQRFEQAIAGDRFVIDRREPVHRRGPGWGQPFLAPALGEEARPGAPPARELPTEPSATSAKL